MGKKYDIVLVAHEKDFNNLKFIVKYAEKNLSFDSIHLILSERGGREFDENQISKNTSRPVYKHIETDILKIDKSKLKYRPNWIYQMLLKMLQNVTQNDNFLVIESDCIILNNLNFFEEEKNIFYLGVNQNHKPYFNFNTKLLNIGREFNYSFISEFMMYNKTIINDLIIKSNSKTKEEFINKIYDLVDEDCYPADYELYGNFYFKYHADKFIFKFLNMDFNGKENSSWTDEEIEFLIEKNKEKDMVCFHTWGLN
jgi:hypothetical protein